MERIKKGKTGRHMSTWAFIPFSILCLGNLTAKLDRLGKHPNFALKIFWHCLWKNNSPLFVWWFSVLLFVCLFVCPFHYQGFSLFTLECSLHICLVACHDHRHVCTPRLHHLLHCSHPHKCHHLPTTFQLTSSDATKTHQISEMAHCFKGLWIILNDWF